MNQIISLNKFEIKNINFFLIILLPISLLTGSLVANINIILIVIFFLADLIIKKDNFIIKDKNFYFLLLIYFYIILNSYFFSNNSESLFKAFALSRFILLAFALNYYFRFFSDEIIRFWAIIFIIVSIDILIEFSFGKNILGFSSSYSGRIASFTGEELKIGGYYFGFFFICLSFFCKRYEKFFFPMMIIFLIISLNIGERSNFIKIFIMCFTYILFFSELSIKKKSLILILTTVLISIFFFKNQTNLKRYFYQVGIITNDKKIQIDQNSFLFKRILESNHHFYHYKVAIELTKNNYLFGIGFKDFRIDSYALSLNYGGSTHPHQTHFEILAELGIIGYLLIIGNIIFVLVRCFREQNKEFLVKGSILFVIATFLPLLPSGSFFTSYGATIFWINYSFLIKSNLKIANKK